MRLAVAALLGITAAACAQGKADVDARPGRAADAPVGAIDAPVGTIDAPVGTIDAPVATIDAPGAADAMPDGMPDAMSDGGVLGNGDTCATANVLGTPATFMFSGDLTGLANDIQPASTCTGFTNDGPDAIFVVTVPAGKTITASITTTWDAAIEITSDCMLNATCLAGSDATAGAATETTSYAVTTTGTYYVVADSWDPASYGPYSLTITIQ